MKDSDYMQPAHPNSMHDFSNVNHLHFHNHNTHIVQGGDSDAGLWVRSIFCCLLLGCPFNLLCEADRCFPSTAEPRIEQANLYKTNSYRY